MEDCMNISLVLKMAAETFPERRALKPGIVLTGEESCCEYGPPRRRQIGHCNGFYRLIVVERPTIAGDPDESSEFIGIAQAPLGDWCLCFKILSLLQQLLYVSGQDIRVVAVMQNDSVLRISSQVVEFWPDLILGIAERALLDQSFSPLTRPVNAATTRADECANDPGHPSVRVLLAHDPADGISGCNCELGQGSSTIETVTILFMENLSARSCVDSRFWIRKNAS
jgi:hypothetical protein